MLTIYCSGIRTHDVKSTCLLSYHLNVVFVAIRNVHPFPNFSYMLCLIMCVCGTNLVWIYFAYSGIRLVVSDFSIWVAVTGFEPVNWSPCLVYMVVYDNIWTWVRSPSVLYVYFIPSKTFLVISQKRSSVSKLQLHVVLDHMCLWYKFGLDIFCLLRHSSGRKWFEYICKGSNPVDVGTHIW